MTLGSRSHHTPQPQRARCGFTRGCLGACGRVTIHLPVCPHAHLCRHDHCRCRRRGCRCCCQEGQSGPPKWRSFTHHPDITGLRGAACLRVDQTCRVMDPCPNNALNAQLCFAFSTITSTHRVADRRGLKAAGYTHLLGPPPRPPSPRSTDDDDDGLASRFPQGAPAQGQGRAEGCSRHVDERRRRASSGLCSPPSQLRAREERRTGHGARRLLAREARRRLATRACARLHPR